MPFAPCSGRKKTECLGTCTLMMCDKILHVCKYERYCTAHNRWRINDVLILVYFNKQECKILHICKYARSYSLHLASREGWKYYVLVLQHFYVQECKILYMWKYARSCAIIMNKVLILAKFYVQEFKILHLCKYAISCALHLAYKGWWNIMT